MQDKTKQAIMRLSGDLVIGLWVCFWSVGGVNRGKRLENGGHQLICNLRTHVPMYTSHKCLNSNVTNMS